MRRLTTKLLLGMIFNYEYLQFSGQMWVRENCGCIFHNWILSDRTPCAYRRLCAVGFLRIIALLTTNVKPSVQPPDYAVIDGKPRSWAGILRIVPHGVFDCECDVFIRLLGTKNLIFTEYHLYC